MIYFIIWVHFVADFIYQTDSMAKGKSSSNVWLGKHILAYTGILWLALAWKWSLQGSLVYCLVNGAAHFATDYITSRITKKLWSQQRVHDFFVVIGFDQAVHMTTLLVTIPLLVKP